VAVQTKVWVMGSDTGSTKQGPCEEGPNSGGERFRLVFAVIWRGRSPAVVVPRQQGWTSLYVM